MIPSVLCVSTREEVSRYCAEISSMGGFRAEFSDSIERVHSGELLCDILILDNHDCSADRYAEVIKFRSNSAHDSLPLILLSLPCDDSPDSAYLFSIGVNDIIRLPAVSEEMTARIKAHARTKRLYDSIILENESLNRELEKSKT
ncbi:MAG: hypothetical protein ACRCUT_03220, partial [Spirochaetota bacterium]